MIEHPLAEVFEWEQPWLERCFYAVLALFGKPAHFLDVGCGDGSLTILAQRLGIEAMGVDLWPSAQEGIVQHNLQKPLSLLRPDGNDLVLCLEVGEHLPEESAAVLAESLYTNLATDGWLIFTAAAPGQDGPGHTNCQPKRWWESKLWAAGCIRDAVLSEHLRSIWAWASGPVFWLPENVMCLRRR